MVKFKEQIKCPFREQNLRRGRKKGGREGGRQRGKEGEKEGRKGGKEGDLFNVYKHCSLPTRRKTV